MDRRSWLWRRRASDKSPNGETESSVSGSGSGSVSVSSPSERLSDEHQASPNQSIQSSEVNSKTMHPDEDVNDGVKILTEKLSAAAATISAKEELIKQHVKVAEEAVSGWEKAENEVITLKQQLDAATKKNSSLEDRIVHLDGALKECLRELRQVKKEKDQELISKKSQDAKSKNSELEVHNSDIQAQLETAKAKLEAATYLESELRLKLDSLENENASLHLELRSRLQELEIRTLERDLSTKTAETASKQHLESIKRVAKLEAECRRFKTMARKATSYNDAKSITEGQSDSGERSNISEPSQSDSLLSTMRNEKTSAITHVTPSSEIDLMDDFLEMEKLAALPMSEDKSPPLESVVALDKHNSNDRGSVKLELETMINKTAELEAKIELIESEKSGLASELTQCQNKLKRSEAQMNTCQNQLKISQAQLREANKKLEMLQSELELANDLRQAMDLELDDANVRREEAEFKCKSMEDERDNLLSKVSFLECDAEKRQDLYAEASVKCKDLEGEVSRLKHELDSEQSQLRSMKRLKEELDRELMSTTAKTEALESQLKDENSEARLLLAKIGSLEKEVESERESSLELSAKCKLLENELSRMKHDTEIWQHRLASANDSKDAVNEELKVMNAKKEEVELQLKNTLDKVSSLESEVEKERKMSAEFSDKCRKLESELLKMKNESNFRISPVSKEELDKQQEKELALAANKLAECQKTIASLGNQLKSLASLEDLFLDSEMLEVSDKESALLHNNGVSLDTLSSETAQDTSTSKEDDGKFAKDRAKDGLLSASLDKRNKHGFRGLFLHTKNMVKS